MKFHNILFPVFLFLSSGISSAQYYETGQEPASVQWMQLKTAHYKVICPVGFGANGRELAKSLENSRISLGSLFPAEKIRIPVVVHPYTTISNGYVTWAPKRMELYPTPEQNTIPLDPYTQLSIHESAHVLQMAALRKGFSKGMSVFLGEQAYGISAFLLPLWLLEGDAVFAETALTGAGRGRSASFQKELKAITIEKPKLYKYDRIVSGSFKAYVPDHYQTGYQMVTWAASKKGPGTWNKALGFTGKYPFMINPVNLSLRKNISLTKKKLYRETFDTLRTIWSKEITISGAKKYPSVNPGKKGDYINYYSPVMPGRDTIIAIKTSLDRAPSIVLIKPSENSEKTIHVPGQVYPYFISCGGGRLVWVELRGDPRWANRQYSILRIMDLRTMKVRSLSSQTRYLSAAISHNGTTIAVTENTVDNKNNLVFIDVATGVLLTTVPTALNAYLQRPEWSDDDRKISFISLTRQGEGIDIFNSMELTWETVVRPGNNDLQSSVIRNDSLFFVSSVSGTDNAYLRDPLGKIWPLTNSRFGVSDLDLFGGRIIFTDYTSSGSDICTADIRAAAGQAAPVTSGLSYLINRVNIKHDTLTATPEYTIKPYHKWQHPFRFHSWMPFYADLETVRSDPSSVRPGITLMSQNTLSTLISTLGYEYSADKRQLFHARVTWQGWYPVIESQIDYGYGPAVSKFGEEVPDPSPLARGIGITNTISVPLSFSAGRFYQFLRPSLSSTYHNSYIYLRETGKYDKSQNLLSARIYFLNYHRFAYRDIFPRWGQSLDLIYSFAPFDKAIYGTELSLRASFYFPGLLPGNGLRIRFEKEKQAPVKFQFTSKVSLPRGYNNIISRDLNLITADYAMPLLYPDLNIGSLVYIKRFRTSLFIDYARGTGNTYYAGSPEGLKPVSFHDYAENFGSAGFELLADFHLFRIPYMISGGAQVAWIKGGTEPVIRALLNIDLFGFAINRGML